MDFIRINESERYRFMIAVKCGDITQRGNRRIRFNYRWNYVTPQFLIWETGFWLSCRWPACHFNEMRTRQAGVTKGTDWADSGCATQSNRSVMDKCICSVVRNEKSILASASRLTDRVRLTRKDSYLAKSPKKPSRTSIEEEALWTNRHFPRILHFQH